MSASMFHWEWYTDPPWDRVSLWWLVNYVKEIRTKPSVQRSMLENRKEFEAVPVPISVLRHLASAEVDPASLPKAPRVDRAPVIEVVQQFSQALEAQNATEAMKLVSRSYLDVNGRNRAQLQSDLKQFAKNMPGLRVISTKVRDVGAVGNQLVATLDVQWTSKGSPGKGRIELFLGQTPRKAWQIESIRTV